ncbi:MAG TPA: helix-turn-helix domain-containing protein [Solirubrobacterales bacterium]|nr:helix-turn-helix domain-containing protein [Solirubrobacterales bacterium]
MGYELDGHHLALMARGEGADALMRDLAGAVDRRLLAVQREEEPTWACWLGGRRQLAPERAVEALGGEIPEGVIVTVGEPGEGLGGWRFSHLQAKAALPIAERRGEPLVRFADVALLAAIARDGGEVARETLRAYFDSERNVSSTAAALGVDRRTVRNRLGAIEELLGRSLRGAEADLEIALRLDE